MDEFLTQHETASGKPTEWQFALHCEINPEHLSQMKNGHREIGDKIARRLEQKLGKDYAWMDLRHDDLSPQGHRVGQRFEGLPADKQRFLLTLITSLEADIDKEDPQSQSC